MNNYDVAFGAGGEDNIRVLIEVVFNPTPAPATVSRVALEVWGRIRERTGAVCSVPLLVNKGDTSSFFFEIPKELVMDNTKGRVCADVGNQRFWSPEFPIDFSQTKP